MELINGLQAVVREPDSVVTVGSFDGLHLGHQKIFRLMRSAGADKVVTIVTFTPHPRSVIRPDDTPQLITTMDERVDILSSMGIDRLIVIPFDKQFAAIPAQEFVKDILYDTIGMSCIFTGDNHRFGRNGEGNIQLLRTLGGQYNFTVETVDRVKRWGTIISSHKIRDVVRAGDVLSAWRFLGRPFYLTGKVIKGDGRGERFGFPTANLALQDADKLKPKPGIYATVTEVNGYRYPSVSHIGQRPTFAGASASIESHIVHFNGKIYGRQLQLGLIDRLRDVREFASAQELVQQMHRDRENALKRLAELGFADDARLRQQRYGKIKG